MKKIYLIKNPELFQGDKYLKGNKTKNYFEGWYFKNISGENGISFIPGINIDGDKRNAFIQVITNDCSYFIDYDIDDFEFNHDSFWIRIGNNYFSKERVHIDIKNEEFNLTVSGNLKYSKSKNINRGFLSPNIMGIFSYIPFIECNHCILSMKNRVDGFIKVNDKEINFSNGIGYIEKDFGYSFPKCYIWGQGNNFKDNSASFMISIADIPFKFFNFTGVICSLIVEEKEYRFATYNNCKVKKFEVSDDTIDVVLKKGPYLLNIKSDNYGSNKLIAPVNGSMNKEIYESINSIIKVTLKKKNKVIFSDISSNCGLEVVNE